MKKLLLAGAVLALVACQDAPEPEMQVEAEPAAEIMAGEFEGTAYGEPITLATLTPVDAILDRPDDFVGELVLIEGVVTDVCDMMGCWMQIQGDREGQTLQVKVDDGVIVFPQEATGQLARVEGVVEKIERTEEEAIEAARHRAEERGLEFDPATVTGPETIYRVKATGAIIAE
jgi:hypothetical protein